MSLETKGSEVGIRYRRAAWQAATTVCCKGFTMGGSPGGPPVRPLRAEMACGPASGQESPGANCASAPVSTPRAKSPRRCLALASKFRRSMTRHWHCSALDCAPGRPMTRTTRPGHFRHLLGPMSVVANMPLVRRSKEQRRSLLTSRGGSSARRGGEAGPRLSCKRKTRTKRAKTVWARRPSR